MSIQLRRPFSRGGGHREGTDVTHGVELAGLVRIQLYEFTRDEPRHPRVSDELPRYLVRSCDVVSCLDIDVLTGEWDLVRADEGSYLLLELSTSFLLSLARFARHDSEQERHGVDSNYIYEAEFKAFYAKEIATNQACATATSTKGCRSCKAQAVSSPRPRDRVLICRHINLSICRPPNPGTEFGCKIVHKYAQAE